VDYRKHVQTCKVTLLLLCGVMLVNQLNAQLAGELYVKTIIVSGALKTKPQVVLRELTFSQKDTLQVKAIPDILQRNQQNIFNLGLFNEVVIEPIVLEQDLHIVIHLKERWYIFPVPQVRFEERNSYDLFQALKNKDFHRVSYGLDLTWYNVTGRNERLSFYGQLGFSKRFRLNYTHPGIFGTKYTDLELGFSYINKNEIITGTEGAEGRWNRTDQSPLETSNNILVGIRKRFGLYKSLTARAIYSWRNYNDSLLYFNRGYIPGERLHVAYPSIMLTFENDQRDWHTYPLDGFRYRVMFRYAGPPDLATHQHAKLGFSWSQFTPLTNRLFFAYNVQNVFTVGKNIPYFEKSAIGMSRSDLPGISTNLRGYEPYAIDGTFVGMAKAEFKLAIIPYQFIHIKHIPLKCFQDMPLGMYITAFCDVGYVNDYSSTAFDTYLKDKGLMGYGMGLNVIGLYDMLFRAEYSRNHFGQGGFYFSGTLPIR